MNECEFIVVRHAEAVDASRFEDDSQRVLTARGEREAHVVGRLRRFMNLPTPDLVFSSGYERAEQTLERVLEGVTLRVIRDQVFSPEGSVERAWKLIVQEVAGLQIGRPPAIWMFGHNPNIERLLSLLSPELGCILRPYRKASLVWLRLSHLSSKRPDAQLVAYLPRPADERDKSAELRS